MRVLLVAIALLLLGAPAAGAQGGTFENPVIPGDRPDPTILRDGDDFWATTTSGDWAPVFPLFHSRDLVNWTQVGSIFPRAPRWATGRFWAPELAKVGGRYVAYYSASRRLGRTCIGAGLAETPAGPWRAWGTVTCPPQGAIDASLTFDDAGTPVLLYKAQGLGGGIWALPLDADGLRAVAAPAPLIAPDARWEHGVVEGPAVVKRDGWWYLFYAGGGCCRPPCSYAEGVARSPNLLGPYEKAPGNPILRTGAGWSCPGHGSLVDLTPPGTPPGAAGAPTTPGATFLLHHANRAGGPLRRHAVLSRVTWGADGWPQLGSDRAPDRFAPLPLGVPQAPRAIRLRDDFDGLALQPGWEWPFDREPRRAVGGGLLALGCAPAERKPAIVTRQLAVDVFAVAATVVRPRTLEHAVGLAVQQGDGALRGVEVTRDVARPFVREGGQVRLGDPLRLPRSRRVRLLVTGGGRGQLATYAAVARPTWTRLAAGPAAFGARPARLALTCRGAGAGRFDSVRVREEAP